METLPPLPARGWNSLFDRLFGGRRRRCPALPLPVHSSVGHSLRTYRDIYNKPIGCVILEEIMQRTLSYLRSIDENLEYWSSKNCWGSSYSQTMYFMIFQRGPGAFVEATCPRLTGLGNNGGPSQSLFESAYNIISTNIHVLKSINRCLAVFLAEVYQQADIGKEGLTGSHRESLCTLFIVLNHVFPKLEELHRKGQTLLFTNDENPSELQFKRLPEVDINSSQWTDAFSANAIGLIYQNLENLDNFVSTLLSRHKKPTHMTLYWFPYTCGAIGFSLCSLWLLRHSSLMGSSDDYNLVQHAKKSIARFWSDPIEPVRYLISIFF
ncbi:protein DGS1, mitochondrial-like [Triticum aestivum]|uniref:protein DGS1, mitochondrial-like n=1 Tax=Triticum aestivum TaxID=4565 RepID=UPI001D0230B9|nr:protein DGS1, mitochondrial-like [Triticum aestivum]